LRICPFGQRVFTISSRTIHACACIYLSGISLWPVQRCLFACWRGRSPRRRDTCDTSHDGGSAAAVCGQSYVRSPKNFMLAGKQRARDAFDRLSPRRGSRRWRRTQLGRFGRAPQLDVTKPGATRIAKAMSRISRALEETRQGRGNSSSSNDADRGPPARRV